MSRFLVILMCGMMLTFAGTSQSRAEAIWVVPLESPVLVKQYRQPATDYSAGHRGVDYLVAEKQAVYAPSDGVVTFVGVIVDRGVLTITHGSNLKTSFEPVCPLVRLDQKVSAGEQIATICSLPTYANHCVPRVCLHFSLRNDRGYLSPLVFIGGLSPSRLLPLKP